MLIDKPPDYGDFILINLDKFLYAPFKLKCTFN